jgi:hypothetical protein
MMRVAFTHPGQARVTIGKARGSVLVEVQHDTRTPGQASLPVAVVVHYRRHTRLGDLLWWNDKGERLELKRLMTGERDSYSGLPFYFQARR